MSEEKKEVCEAAGRVGRDVTGEIILCEAAGDYVLPDYQPEIRKVLAVRASLLPSGQYVGGERAEFGGRVMQEVLYTAEDGSLHAVTLPADYSFTAPLPCESPVCVTADSMTEGTVCRLGGPRKLSLRTRLRNTVHILAEEDVTPEIRGMGSEEDTASLEKLTGECASLSYATGDSGEFSLRDTVRLENSAEATRVVRNGGNLLVSECRVREGGCLVRGEAWVRALLADEGAPYTVRTKIPFEQFVPIEGDLTGGTASAYGRVCLLDSTVAPGEEGAPGHLIFDLSAELEVTVVRPTLCHPTFDLYSTAYEMTCQRKTLPCTRLLGCVSGNYTVSGSRPRSECEAEDAAFLADADGRVDIASVTVEHGRATVHGNVYVQAIFGTPPTADAPTALQAADLPVPFRIETDLRLPQGSSPRFDCHAELIAVRGRIEQNALAADCEISLILRATESSELNILSAAEPDCATPVAPCGESLLVCYPQEGDTLWSLAARYRVSRARLASENGLGEEALSLSHLTASLDGIHHLIIAK